MTNVASKELVPRSYVCFRPFRQLTMLRSTYIDRQCHTCARGTKDVALHLLHFTPIRDTGQSTQALCVMQVHGRLLAPVFDRGDLRDLGTRGGERAAVYDDSSHCCNNYHFIHSIPGPIHIPAMMEVDIMYNVRKNCLKEGIVPKKHVEHGQVAVHYIESHRTFRAGP